MRLWPQGSYGIEGVRDSGVAPIRDNDRALLGWSGGGEEGPSPRLGDGRKVRKCSKGSDVHSLLGGEAAPR